MFLLDWFGHSLNRGVPYATHTLSKGSLFEMILVYAVHYFVFPTISPPHKKWDKREYKHWILEMIMCNECLNIT